MGAAGGHGATGVQDAILSRVLQCLRCCSAPGAILDIGAFLAESTCASDVSCATLVMGASGLSCAAFTIDALAQVSGVATGISFAALVLSAAGVSGFSLMGATVDPSVTVFMALPGFFGTTVVLSVVSQVLFLP